MGAIIVAVFGEWFIKVAEDKGWYANAGRTWDRVMASIIDFATSPPVLYTVTALGGLVAGVWLDTLLARKERAALARAPDPTPKQPNLMPVSSPPPISVRDRRAIDSAGFDYPYPKAVLQASIARTKGTLEAGQDGVPFKLSIIMQVTNMHRAPIKEWYATISRASVDGDSIPISGELRISKNYQALPVGSVANITILTRDISDIISKPPFLIKLVGKDVPIKENREYLVGIELHCGNSHYTDVLLSIQTGKNLEAEVRVIHQCPEPRWLAGTAAETPQ